MFDLKKRDGEIAAAHEALSVAIRHLNTATTHGGDLDRHMLGGIMRQLCDAREPLSEHVEIHS